MKPIQRLVAGGIRAILADPVRRRTLMTRAIYAAQAAEDPTMTMARAEAAYDRVHGPGGTVTGPDEHGSLYVQVRPAARVARTQTVPAQVIVDFDAQGALVGVEVLGLPRTAA